jgi:AraC-like DNA-binding protein
MYANNVRTYREQIGDGQIRMMRLRCRDDAPHRHSFFELVYVFRGTTFHHIGDEITQLHAGDYFIIDPGSIHCYQNGNDCHIVNCLFLPEYIDRALADCPSISALLTNRTLRFGVPVDISIADRVFHDTDGSVRRIVRNMEREYAECPTGHMEMLRCYLTQVLVLAARACETRVPHEAVTKVMEYLKHHYAEPLSLDALSQLVGYTPQYLSSLFSNEVGMSIQMFLQRMRVEEACKLLVGTNLSVAEVASSVGYQDTRHFSKVFCRYQTISPKEYRKAATTNK